MMQKIKQVFSWLIDKVKTGAAWLRENRPWLQEQARQTSRQVHKALMVVQRQVWAKFNQGRALAILTVQYRQNGKMTFSQALEQAKTEVRSMSAAEIAHLVVNFFTESTETQMAKVTV